MPSVCLVTIYIAALAAEFVAPYDYSQQNREATLASPTKLHWVDSEGRLHLRPFVYLMSEDSQEGSAYTEEIESAYPVQFFVLEPDHGSNGHPTRHWHLFGVDQPAYLFLLGTDELGRDVFSRLVYGGRVSLLAGLFATFLSLGLATILGSVAGFYGSWIDAGIMRLAESFIALPWLYLLLALRALLPLHIDPMHVFFLVIALIGMLGWARPTRLIRGMVLSLRERRYILAARSFGASDLYLIRRHILPGIGSLLLTQAALMVPQYVLAEVTLSFFGLGIGEPVPSWGGMLASLLNYRVLVSAWWMFTPGVLMAVVFLSYRAIHDALRSGVSMAAGL